MGDYKRNAVLVVSLILFITGMAFAFNSLEDVGKIPKEFLPPSESGITGNVVYSENGAYVTVEELAEGVYLDSGWKGVFWPNNMTPNLSIYDAFGSFINDNVSSHIWSQGQVWINPEDRFGQWAGTYIDTLRTVNPRQLYYIKMSRDGVLRYPETLTATLSTGEVIAVNSPVTIFPNGTYEYRDISLGENSIKKGIWISQEEIDLLPTNGTGWQRVLQRANEPANSPDLSNQNDNDNVRVLAKALVYAKTGQTSYRDEVVSAITTITYDNTEAGGRTLALGRELGAYVIAAEVIDLKSVNPSLDNDFRIKLIYLQTVVLESKTLISTHNVRPNNWGTHAGFSRMAVALYINDTVDFEEAANVFHGWLGNTEAYNGFDYGDLCWESNTNSPVGINPLGATLNIGGTLRDVDGVIPDDQRRGNSPYPDFNGGCPSYVGWPAERQGYAWSALQGTIAQAVVLDRKGYDAFEWEDQAVLRAYDWLHRTEFQEGVGYPAEGDDRWQPWLVNYYYCTNYPSESPSQEGKNIGFSDWTHSDVGPGC